MHSVQFSSVQLLSRVLFFGTPWAASLQASLSITNFRGLIKLMSIESVMPSRHLHPLPSPSPPAPNPSQHQGLFQWVSSSHEVASVLELQLQHQSSNEYSGLISFRMDWLDLLALQRTLKSLLQHHSSKASVLWCSAFSMGHSNIHTWLLDKPLLWLDRPLLAK